MSMIEDPRPFVDLSSTGMLWLINRVVFHPRGFALALDVKEGEAVGWLLLGDGSEPWSFPPVDEPECYRRVEELLAARTVNRPESVTGDS